MTSSMPPATSRGARPDRREDAAVAKSTYVRLLGVEQARLAAARQAPGGGGERPRSLRRALDTLAALARYIVTRRY